MQNYMGSFADVFHVIANTPAAMRCCSFGYERLFGRRRACSEFWPTFSASQLCFLSFFPSPLPSLSCIPSHLETRPICDLSSSATNSAKDYVGIHARTAWRLPLSSRTWNDEGLCSGLWYQVLSFWQPYWNIQDILTFDQQRTTYLSPRYRPFIINPLNAELNPICYLLALLGAHHFLHVNRIRVKSLTLRLLMLYIYIYIYGAPILDVSRSHTTTHHSR